MNETPDPKRHWAGMSASQKWEFAGEVFSTLGWLVLLIGVLALLAAAVG